MLARGELLQKAKLAERSGRPRQMAAFMRELVEMDVALMEEEREILTVAYYKMLGELLEGEGRMRDVVQQCEGEAKASMRSLQAQLLGEVCNACAEITELITRHALPSATTPESEVFYTKWHADTLRIALRYVDEAHKEELLGGIKDLYAKAMQLALLDLSPVNSVRLALVLNYCTYYAETMKQPREAVDMANAAIEDAAAEWTEQKTKQHTPSATVLHLLHKNSVHWSREAGFPNHLDPEDPTDTDSLTSSQDDDLFVVSPSKGTLDTPTDIGRHLLVE